jgi:hypothetical protein
LTKADQAPAAEVEPTAAPEATVTSLQPRRKVVGKPKVRQNLKGPKIGKGNRITKPTFGSVTSTTF